MPARDREGRSDGGVLALEARQTASGIASESLERLEKFPSQP